MKTCTKCGETKPLDEYHKHKQRKDGRHAQCKPCSLAQRAEWYIENRETILARQEGYYAENRETILARRADYREANPHIRWEQGVRDRATEYGTNPRIDRITKADVIERYGDACHHCKTGAFESLDHYPTPIVRGGEHVIDNVKPSCMNCQQYSWREGFTPLNQTDVRKTA